MSPVAIFPISLYSRAVFPRFHLVTMGKRSSYRFVYHLQVSTRRTSAFLSLLLWIQVVSPYIFWVAYFCFALLCAFILFELSQEMNDPTIGPFSHTYFLHVRMGCACASRRFIIKDHPFVLWNWAWVHGSACSRNSLKMLLISCWSILMLSGLFTSFIWQPIASSRVTSLRKGLWSLPSPPCHQE